MAKKGTPSLLQNESLPTVAGLILFFTASFSALSSAATLWFWREDFSHFTGSFWSVLTDDSVTVSNTFGKIGAAIGQTLVVNGLGVAIFGWLFWIAAAGLRLAFLTPFAGLRWLRHIAWITLLLTCGLSLALPATWGPWGGAMGDYLAHWGAAWVGMSGIWFAWGAAIVLYAVWMLRVTPRQLAALVAKKSPDNASAPWDATTPPLDLTVTQEPLVEEKVAPVVDFSSDREQESIPSTTATSTPLEIEPAQKEKTGTESTSKGGESVEYGTIGSAYDPKKDLSKYRIPPLELLNDYGGQEIVVDQKELEANKDKIVETLSHYKIEIARIKATIGPTVTLYEIVPAAGVRISKIKSLEDDIALSLSALGIRIIAPIPGRGTIGIEVPSKSPQTVSMKSVLATEKFQNSGFELPVALGKTISNEIFVADLTKMPHLLMAGATGQGKSVGLNAILSSILYKKHPSEVKFVLVDPKKVELTLYNKIERHFLAKLPDDSEAIITDTSKVINTLNSLCIEMDQRYDLLKIAMVRNIKEYNEKFIVRKLNPEEGHRYLPYIVLVIDEFADLIMTAGKEVETPIARLAQLARAIGIHLIIATQRPSVNVITGIIKANFPARIAFKVASKIDSRTILDAGGADQLIGRGDMLFSAGNDLVRIQCAFLDTPEVENICSFIGDQTAPSSPYQLPEYNGPEGGSGGMGPMDPNDRDEFFEEAARVVVMHQQGSASLLQRKLKLGYNRAGRLVDQLEAAGIIGPFEGSKARQVLVQDGAHLEHILSALRG